MSLVQNQTQHASLSVTNFDLPSLFLLRREIDVALEDAETHLSEFNDDEEQAPLMLDSIEVLKQLAAVLNLIRLTGGSDLAQVLANSLQALYDAGDNSNDDLILNISEGIMTLDRYIEFVLLKETLEPSLLIDVINRLNTCIGHPTIDESSFTKSDTINISIANPEQNYVPIAKLNLDEALLSSAYRAGLSVALTNVNGQTSEDDQRKLEAMYSACALAAKHSDTLFWRAAQAVTQDIKNILPLSTAKKRTLIFLEQQFHNYLPTNDNRFADLVSFACLREHSFAEQIKQEYAVNCLDDEQRAQMKRFLFGPNREVASKLNQLIQDEISTIKDKVDAFVRGDQANPSVDDTADISEKLSALSSVMSLLNLDKASAALKQSAANIKSWKVPTPEDFDTLLSSLIVAENSAIYLAKTHTPGAIIQPSHNNLISVYQLDTAYDTVVKESRTMVATIEQALNQYMEDSQKDILNISNTPEMIRQIAGAARFLGLNDGANMLSRLARFIDEDILATGSNVSDDALARIADVLMVVDYQLEGLENNHPVSNHALHIGNHSLKELLAA